MTHERRSTRPSLRRRVTLASLGVAVVSVAVAFLVFYLAWTQYTLSVRARELTRQVEVVARGLEVGGVPSSVEEFAPVRASLLRVESGLIAARLVVTDEVGTVVYSTADEKSDRPYPTAEMLAEGAEGDVFYTGLRTVETGGRALVVGARLGEANRYLLAVQPVREIGEAGAGVLGLLGVAAVVATAVAWAAGTWLARRITGPLVRLTAGARAVAAGDWGHQVPPEGDDEVAQLAGAFNEMSARVADAYRAQQAFVGDVSHELRTPITSITGFAGALLDGTVTDEEGRNRSLEVIRAEAARISDLSRTLLSLADLDAGNIRVAREPVDTDTLADALRSRFETRAADKHIRLEVARPDGAPIGDDERLVQVASILLDNALAYTPVGGRVGVSMFVEGPSWFLAVDDSGPGVPQADRERVFGRFTRLDASRNAAAGGTGLGLAICRRLVELMGGAVRVEDGPLGGARFLISLPAAQ